MTDQRKTDLHPADLAGAYALHALDVEDTVAFKKYLLESEQARIEAAELSDTAVALGLAVAPVQPSAALKSNLMAMLASTPQLSPAPGTSGPTAVDAPAPGDSSAADTAPAEPSNGYTGHSPATERAQIRWFKRPALSLLAAAAAVALFVGGISLGSALNNTQFESQQAAGLAKINAAMDSQRAATTTANGQDATLVWSNQLGLSAVLVDNLPALPANEDYQLWYINADGAAPAGTFDSTGDGTVWRVLEGTMQAGDAVGVTIEPNGGSDQPTTDPIVAFQS